MPGRRIDGAPCGRVGFRDRMVRRLVRLAALTAAMGVVAALAGAVEPAAGGLRPGHGSPPRSGPFGWLVPAPAPPTWRHQTAPSGAATLWYPPSFAAVAGDPGSISAGLRSPAGKFRVYLNVTPRQGDERARGFAAFRVHLLGAEHDRSVHQDAAAEGLGFRGGTGSCVLDDYVTRIGHNRYREIACFVTAPHGASVVVAAATTAEWSRFQALLRRVVASFTVA
jgi:hypothetical protein